MVRALLEEYLSAWRARAFSPGYQITGFQPGWERSPVRFTLKALKGRHVIT
jgi:hypothetical protein